jgi:hypothetical protein
MPTFARVESSSLGMSMLVAGVVTAENDGDVLVAAIACEEGGSVTGDELGAAPPVVANLNCQPLKGIPITLVGAVAMADVFTQPASPSKSLAN